jgi:hypothetical protein
MPGTHRSREAPRLEVAGLATLAVASLLMVVGVIFPTPAEGHAGESCPAPLPGRSVNNPGNGAMDLGGGNPITIDPTVDPDGSPPGPGGGDPDLPPPGGVFECNENGVLPNASHLQGQFTTTTVEECPSGTTTTTVTDPAGTTTVTQTNTSTVTVPTTVTTTITTVAVTIAAAPNPAPALDQPLQEGFCHVTTTTTTTVTETTTTNTTTTVTQPTTVTVTTTTHTVVGEPTTVTPPEPTEVDPTVTSPGTSVHPTTVSSAGGTAFTGPENVIPLATIVVVLMTAGSGLLWADGRRRRREEDGD